MVGSESSSIGEEGPLAYVIAPRGAEPLTPSLGGEERPEVDANRSRRPAQRAHRGIDLAQFQTLPSLVVDSRAVALGGGSLTTLAMGQDQPSDIAVDAASVYWTNYADDHMAAVGTVAKVALDGGSPVTLASGQNAPTGIAVDASTVYWTNWGGSTVLKVAVGGGGSTTLASGPDYPAGIATDGTNAYWVAGGAGGCCSGVVMQVALTGGTPTTLASGQGEPNAIAVDATSVYWTDGDPFSGGAVMKVAKP